MNIVELRKEFKKYNANEKTSKKGKFTYLSWADAWDIVLDFDPSATFKISKQEDGPLKGTPIFGNSAIGWMCYTDVTICGLTRQGFLHVMDNKNNAIKKPDMGIINKTVQRCLVKTISLFGLGLYIYRGQDLPDEFDVEGKGHDIEPGPKLEDDKLTPLQEEALNLIYGAGVSEKQALSIAKVELIEELKEGELCDLMFEKLNIKIAKNKEKNAKTKKENEKVKTKTVEVAKEEKISENEKLQKEIKELIEKAGIVPEKAYSVAGAKTLEEIVPGASADSLVKMLKNYIKKNNK